MNLHFDKYHAAAKLATLAKDHLLKWVIDETAFPIAKSQYT